MSFDMDNIQNVQCPVLFFNFIISKDLHLWKSGRGESFKRVSADFQQSSTYVNLALNYSGPFVCIS